MRRTSALLGFIAILCASVPLLSLLSAFAPEIKKAKTHRYENLKSLILRQEDATRDISLARVDGGWFYMDAVSGEERGAVRHAGAGDRNESITFTEDGIALLTAAGARLLTPRRYGSSLHAQPPEESFLLSSPPPQYGEPLSIAGRPLRWFAARPSDASGARICLLPPSGKKENTAPIGAPPGQPHENGSIFSRAQPYKALVERFAERYKIPAELVYAIIHNESNFRPGTVSSRQALGLMQLLPSTAGGEVHKFLHGYSSELDAAELMAPENNLRYGVAYLHLLLTRHFGDVEHPESREFCAIAAYNLGPNALANAFSRDRDEAIAIINSLSPQELYERLAEELPVRETRNFIARVVNSKKEFTDFQ